VTAPKARHSALYFAISFVQALDNQLVPVLLPELRSEMDGAPAGQLLTAYALACGVAPFLATMRGSADRVRTLAVAALALLALAAIGFGSTASFGARLGLRAAAGAASGVLSMTLLLAASRVQDPAARARQFTLVNAGYLVALVVGVPLGAKAVVHFDVGAIYLAIGAIAALLGVASLRMPRDETAGAGAARHASIVRLLRHREAGLILLATGVVGAAMAGPVGFLGSFLASDRGMDTDAIGAVYMWAGIGPLLAMPISGRVIARWRPDRIAIAGSLVIAVPIFLFGVLASSLATAASVMLACVFIETIRRAALQGSLAEAAPGPDLPRYLALRGVIVQLGLAAGYALAELQFGRWGFGAVCRIAAAMSVAAAGILFASRMGRAAGGAGARVPE
jgi:DHA1 family inner membrane transport protein